MVSRAFGACNRRDFEYVRSNRAVVARGDVTHMSEDVRHFKRILDVAYVAERRGNDDDTAF